MTMIIRMLSPRCDRTFWYYIEVYYFCSFFFVFKLPGIIIYQIIKHLSCWLYGLEGQLMRKYEPIWRQKQKVLCIDGIYF